jgi:hypothetical protein
MASQAPSIRANTRTLNTALRGDLWLTARGGPPAFRSAWNGNLRAHWEAEQGILGLLALSLLLSHATVAAWKVALSQILDQRIRWSENL